MTTYEIMFIVKATLEESEIKKIAEDLKKLVSNKQSKVIEMNELGRKKLAYPINKELGGFYYVLKVETDHETIKEFDRKVSLNENVLRHLIIKLESE